MPIKRLAATCLALAALAPPLAAQTDAVCDERSALITVLEDLYGEQHVATGLEDPTSMLEIWVSADTGTWTILTTRPDGVSCIAMAGGNWAESSPLTRAEGVLH